MQDVASSPVIRLSEHVVEAGCSKLAAHCPSTPPTPGNQSVLPAFPMVTSTNGKSKRTCIAPGPDSCDGASSAEIRQEAPPQENEEDARLLAEAVALACFAPSPPLTEIGCPEGSPQEESVPCEKASATAAASATQVEPARCTYVGAEPSYSKRKSSSTTAQTEASIHEKAVAIAAAAAAARTSLGLGNGLSRYLMEGMCATMAQVVHEFPLENVLGDWIDSLGNLVLVQCVDAYQLSLKATLFRPPRKDIHLAVRRMSDGSWYCGNAILDQEASSFMELFWTTADGRVSIWMRPAHGGCGVVDTCLTTIDAFEGG
eukprot:TRINITY_DN40821_c0_g1_i1.p1 TRINITY_DN40821_c0_g1~~TRINITY_DN40821_c0_g1_i1.p1  ORF type:complete len:316 (+),score=54.36 TRINITY_DN40821_c0_g1_i1:135-1082(+)